MPTLTEVEFTSHDTSVAVALNQVKVPKFLAKRKTVLIKPNLINASPHPVITPAACCEAIVMYVRQCSTAEMDIGEGCGDSSLETDEIFDIHGYREMADRYGITVLDLNHAPLVCRLNPASTVFQEMMLPEIAFSHTIISVPVLKAHSFSTITGSLKNIMGFPPPKYYSGQFSTWKKAAFHRQMHRAIRDLCYYIKPQLTDMDATIGLAEFHLGGDHCSPPLNRIIAGFEPVEVDRRGAELLIKPFEYTG